MKLSLNLCSKSETNAAESKDAGDANLDTCHLIEVNVEASTSIAFSVKLLQEEQSIILSKCRTCFGYTRRGERCRNQRIAGEDEAVWCYHHANQMKKYELYLLLGDRPPSCTWW